MLHVPTRTENFPPIILFLFSEICLCIFLLEFHHRIVGYLKNLKRKENFVSLFYSDLLLCVKIIGNYLGYLRYLLFPVRNSEEIFQI